MNPNLSIFLVFLIATLIIGIFIFEKTRNIIPVLTYQVLMVSTLFMFFATNQLPELAFYMTKQGQLMGMLFLSIFSLATLSLSRVQIKWMAALLGFAEFLMMAINWIWPDRPGLEPYGLNLNSSLDCVTLMMLWPLAESSRRPNAWPQYLALFFRFGIPMAVIVSTKTSMGLLAGAIVGAGLVVIQYGVPGMIASAGLGVASIIWGFNTTLGAMYLDSNGRLEIWRQTMTWFWEQGRIWFGHGLGSYYGLGPYIQFLNGKTDEKGWFLFLHSDWLQVLFEGGVVGFVAVGFTYAWLCRVAFRKQLYLELVALIVVGMSSLGDMVFRYGWSCFAACLVVASILAPKNPTCNDPVQMIDDFRKAMKLRINK